MTKGEIRGTGHFQNPPAVDYDDKKGPRNIAIEAHRVQNN